MCPIMQYNFQPKYMYIPSYLYTILWIYSRFIPAEVLIMKFYTAKFKTTSKVNKIVTCTKSIQTNVRVSKILRETPQVYTLYGQ